MILDNWQQEVLNTEGNIVLRSGRQVGKSTVISIKAADYAVKHKDKTILIIASVERQARLLFDKTLNYLYENYKSYIKKGKERPTQHVIKLNNGSVIHCLPTGLSGYGIRGYTIDLLIADEAAFIEEEVWTAVTPMLAVTKGQIILLSTPHGKKGYFYNCFKDETFKSFHISAEDSPRKDEVFLKHERERMTKAQYAQEYLGEFLDELRQFFNTELIKECMKPKLIRNGDNFLGVDVARLGNDETVLLSLTKISDKLYMNDLLITKYNYLTETVKRIKDLDSIFDYKRIYIDTGGMGVGVFDPLLADEQTKRKVVSIDNSSKAVSSDNSVKRKLLKEDLYNNLLNLMENHNLELFDEPEIFLSLKSIQYEYEDGRLKIFGDYSHITEALVRAAWCMKEKGLNIWVEFN